MSTTQDSAHEWVETKNPTDSEIDGVIVKLQHRIASSGASEAQLVGTKEALAYLLQELADRKEFSNPATLETSPSDFSLNSSENNTLDNTFDSSGLISDSNNIAPKCQSADEKKQRLNDLMNNIKRVGDDGLLR